MLKPPVQLDSKADMVVSTASPTPVAPGAPTSKPYDPAKTMDGMFKGSVIRMAFAFKDPKSYGESTRVIISECSKKYQDALDDCEIQLLDAKWYLEQKLAENKAKREAKAKEASAASVKRKHEEAADKDVDMAVDSPSKRKKSNEQPSPKSVSAVGNLSNIKEEPKTGSNTPTAPSQPQQPKSDPQSSKPAQPASKQEDKKPSTPQPPVPSQIQKPEPKQADPPPAPADDFPKQTPNVTPSMTNDDFTFESMFTDELGDADGLDDMNIGLDDDPFGDDFGSSTIANDTSTNTQSAALTQPQTQPQSQAMQKSNSNAPAPQNAFSSLLEGVEQLANQADDTQKSGLGSGTNAFTGDIDMGTNIFDSFLNDEFDVGSNNGNNDFGVDDFGNDDGEVNFDELFGD